MILQKRDSVLLQSNTKHRRGTWRRSRHSNKMTISLYQKHAIQLYRSTCNVAEGLGLLVNWSVTSIVHKTQIKKQNLPQKWHFSLQLRQLPVWRKMRRCNSLFGAGWWRNQARNHAVFDQAGARSLKTHTHTHTQRKKQTNKQKKPRDLALLQVLHPSHLWNDHIRNKLFISTRGR